MTQNNRRILAADIGGTNSRFAAFSLSDGGKMTLDEIIWLQSHEAQSFPELLELLEQADFGLNPGECSAAVFAVPGPVEQCTRAELANIDWPIDLELIRQKYRGERFYLINDFAAQAYAMRTEAMQEAQIIQSGAPMTGGVEAVIGAGTGLGHCALVPDDGGFTAVPSEAGHAVFGFYGADELDYQRFLLAVTDKPFAYGDLVVSGLGLRIVHWFLTGDDLSPEEVSAAIGPQSPTTEWFARFYGRACRNYALNVVATGGMVISGGVAAKNPFLVTHPAFTREFSFSPSYSGMLAAIPVSLNANEQSGLWGAAFYGAQKTEYSPA